MPTIEQFTPVTTEKPWGEEILVASVPADSRGRTHGGYTGKVLFRFTGRNLEGEPYHRAGLQWHRTRDETFYLYSGEVIVYFVDATNKLRKYHMHPGESFHVPPGAIHSVETITDSVMFEVSAPPSVRSDETVNVEADWDITQAVVWWP